MKPAHYRVLVTLLDYAHSDGSMAHPGVALLARDCCMHVETVTQALRRLCEDGYIVKTYQGGHQRGASSYSFAPHPQPSPQASLSQRHNKVKITETPASQQSPQTATSVDEQIESHGNDDPWGSPPEPDQRSGGRQVPEDEGVGPGTGSLCSPGDPLDSPSGTPDDDIGPPCEYCHAYPHESHPYNCPNSLDRL
ncbi:helix-turn-helix domain-containing protein [Mycobacterium colombiense]|uniref:helix-turn-helix domain-containing protein n=1 Tax=Mycobacterium colombiense TaxID=339268 RepID=UPI001153D2DD